MTSTGSFLKSWTRGRDASCHEGRLSLTTCLTNPTCWWSGRCWCSCPSSTHLDILHPSCTLSVLLHQPFALLCLWGLTRQPSDDKRGQEAVCNGQDQAASQGGALPCHGCQMHLLPAATYHMIRIISGSGSETLKIHHMTISIHGSHMHLYLQCLLSSYLQIRNAPDDYSNKSDKDKENNNENKMKITATLDAREVRMVWKDLHGSLSFPLLLFSIW